MTSTPIVPDKLIRLKKSQLVDEVVSLHAEIAILTGGSTYGKQKTATARVADAVLAEEDKLLDTLRHAAYGYTTAAACQTKGCDLQGHTVACQECGEVPTVDIPGSPKHAKDLLDYVLIPPSGSKEELGDEFKEALALIVMEEFDRANQHDRASERKQVFSDGLSRRFAATRA